MATEETNLVDVIARSAVAPILLTAALSAVFGVALVYAELRASVYSKAIEVTVGPLFVVCTLWWYSADTKLRAIPRSRLLIGLSVFLPYLSVPIYLWRSRAGSGRIVAIVKFFGFVIALILLLVVAAFVTGLVLSSK